MGPWGLAASIFSIVVGASIFVLPAALALNVGLYAVPVILVCAVGVGSVAICFAEGGSRIPSSGGAYGYIQAVFGPLAGYISGTLLWFSAALASGGIASAAADIGAGAVPEPYKETVRALIVIGSVSAIAIINIGGIERGMKLVNALALLKLLPLGIFLVAGVGAMHTVNFHTTAPPNGGGVGRALILALFAFTGMETALCASGEVTTPERTIPRALALAMGAVTLLYVAIQLIAQGILGSSLAASSEPLADAMGRISPLLRGFILAGAALSMVGYLSGDTLSTPRILFAFARDGLLPKALGRLHARSHAPHVAIVCYAALTIGFALTGSFAELAVLSALALAPFYIAGCIAAWQLRRRRVALAGTPLNFSGLGVAVALGTLSMIVLIASADASEIGGLAALIAVSALLYWGQSRFQRRRRL